MNLLLGIGNEDKGDDGVGPYLARILDLPGWIGLDGGTAPENVTGVIRKHAPERVVLVDATDMGLEPGAIRRIPRDRIEDVGIGTHMLPLTHLIDYLSGFVGYVITVGIQPVSTRFGDDMNPAVVEAGRRLLHILKSQHLSMVPVIE